MNYLLAAAVNVQIISVLLLSHVFESPIFLTCCSPGTVFPIVNVLPGMIESFWSTTQRYPWLWGIYFFIVGLPVVLFISFMWPDKVVIHPSICNEATKMSLKCKYYRLNTYVLLNIIIVSLDRHAPSKQLYSIWLKLNRENIPVNFRTHPSATIIKHE